MKLFMGKVTQAIIPFIISSVFLCVSGPLSRVLAASPWDDNFNDSAVNTALWQYVDVNNFQTTFKEQNARLEWYVNGSDWPAEGRYASESFVSQWQYDLQSDFTCKVDFLHNTTAGQGTGLNFGVYYGDKQHETPDFFAAIGAENAVNNGTKYLRYDWQVGGKDIAGNQGNLLRYTADGTGTLYIDYIHDQGKLYLYGADNAVKIPIAIPSTVDSLGVYLEGWATGGTTIFHTSPSYFDNFTTAPEPVSMALFAAGGMLLGLARKLRRKRV
jgi:hypothetical protein